MRQSRLLKFIIWFGCAGACVAVVIFALALTIGTFPGWLITAALTVCPFTILLWATEHCPALWSWCVIQIVLIMIVLNTVLYAGLGLIVFAVKALRDRILAKARSHSAP
jgi:hypothetical protein